MARLVLIDSEYFVEQAHPDKGGVRIRFKDNKAVIDIVSKAGTASNMWAHMDINALEQLASDIYCAIEEMKSAGIR